MIKNPEQQHPQPEQAPEKHKSGAEMNEQQFKDLWKKSYPDLLRYCTYLYRNSSPNPTEDAQNLTQEVALKAWASKHQFRGDSEFNGWLFVIARNTLHEILRKGNATKNSFDNVKKNVGFFDQNGNDIVVDEKALSENELINNIDKELLKEKLETILPEKARRVFELRFFEGYKFSEISDIMGIAEGTARSHFDNAIKKINKALYPKLKKQPTK